MYQSAGDHVANVTCLVTVAHSVLAGKHFKLHCMLVDMWRDVSGGLPTEANSRIDCFRWGIECFDLSSLLWRAGSRDWPTSYGPSH